MGPARLTGALLARKGDAAPIRGAYGGTILEPMPGLFGSAPARAQAPAGLDHRKGPAPAPAPAVHPVASTSEVVRAPAPPRRTRSAEPADTARLSLRLDAEQLTRLRILAARRGRRPQQLLREALETVFAGTSDACPCVRGPDDPCCNAPPQRPSSS
jgi:hypothetical protein